MENHEGRNSTGGVLLQYADDTTLICSAPDTQEVAVLMNSHLRVISKWTEDNRMAFNLSKSSVMWFSVPGHRKTVRIPSIYVGNIPLSVVSKQKYLGLMLDDALSQVSKVCQLMCLLFVFIK